MKSLKEISAGNPFRVPENYFEEVNRKILSSTIQIPEKTRPVGLIHRLRPVLAVAASLALLVLLSYSVVKIFLPEAKADGPPTISMEEFSDIYLNDIDVNTLEAEADPIASFEQIPEMSKSEIIEYLILENINVDDIYELL